LCAVRAVNACQHPTFEVFYNSAQTVVISCPDGLLFYYTVPAGLFPAYSQNSADQIAISYGQAEVARRRVCLSSFAISGICTFAYLTLDIVASGNYAPFTFSLVSGELPPGTTLIQTGADTFNLSGIPTTPGIYVFTVQVVSAMGDVMSKTYSLVVASITTASPLPDGVAGIAYSAYFEQVGLTEAFAYTADSMDIDVDSDIITSDMTGSNLIWTITSGTLPDGLTLDNSGNISGTPTETGSFSFNVSVTDGTITCDKDFTLNIELGSVRIQGYTDGMIANPTGAVAVAEPVWDGVYAFFNAVSMFGYTDIFTSSFNYGVQQMDGRVITVAFLYTPAVPTTRRISIMDSFGNGLWSGENGDATSIFGQYNRVGGTDATPAFVIIEAAPDVVQPGNYP
jgi:hypothetical protein